MRMDTFSEVTGGRRLSNLVGKTSIPKADMAEYRSLMNHFTSA
jgi:hypothetical protein